jgi:uncharacterized protein with PQ loop repeat
MTAVLGMLAAAFSIALVWPQVWLSCRHRRTSGLSATACWLLYGLFLGDTVQIATNAVVGAANTLILGALLFMQPSLRTRRVLARTAWSAAVLGAGALGSVVVVGIFGVSPVTVAAVLGAGASLVGALQGVPQPVSLLRDRTQDLSGLSPMRWWLTVASCLSWVGYGVSCGQVAVWSSALAGLACAATVCGVLVTARSSAVDAGEWQPDAPIGVRPGTQSTVALAA